MTKPKLAHDDPDQSKRFLDLAKELEVDADDRDLKASVKRLAEHVPEPRRKLGKKAKSVQKRSTGNP